MWGSHYLKMKNHLVCEFVWGCCFLLFSAFWRPAHVLPVCMINLFPLIIYVIQNVIYVSVNFELWPMRRIVNLSSQTLSEYTLLHSLVWSTHKSLQTGAEVHSFFPSFFSSSLFSFILSFLPTHSLFLMEVWDFRSDKTTVKRLAHFWEQMWRNQNSYW